MNKNDEEIELLEPLEETIELLLPIEDEKETKKLPKRKSKRIGNKVLLVIGLLGIFVVLGFSTSYALFTFNVTKNTTFKVSVGNLELKNFRYENTR